MNYNEWLMHFNPNHDPKNGEFTEGHGGQASGKPSGVGKIKQKSKDEKQNGNKTSNVHGIQMTEQQKRMLKIGAAAAIAALAICGGVALAKSGKLGSLGKGKEAIEQLASTASEKSTATMEQLASASSGLNPTYESITEIPKAFDGAPLNKVNCQACTLAYEMRRRFGNDAVKSAKLVDTRVMGDIFEKVFDADSMEQSFVGTSGLSNALIDMGNGARGNLVIESKMMGGMHSIAFEVIGGKAMAFDCQSGVSFDLASEKLKELYDVGSLNIVTRLDNLGLADNAEEVLSQVLNR